MDKQEIASQLQTIIDKQYADFLDIKLDLIDLLGEIDNDEDS